MRWQTAILAGAFALAACETNDATELIEVTAADLAGTYEMLSIGGVTPAALDEGYCVNSTLMMEADGDFDIRHRYTERVGIGVNQACSTAPDRFTFDVFWRGRFDNTSTLVVMTVTESEVAWSGGSEVTPESTELVGEFNPNTGRLVVAFPDIWGFDPHGGSGGKISTGGDARGLGAGTMVFEK